MAGNIPFPTPQREGGGFLEVDEPDLRTLFHQLNNQLGIILANAELLKARLRDPTGTARADHILSSAVEAISLAKNIRVHAMRSSG